MADVLIVDDNADIRNLLALILHAAGHEVRKASNGREGLDLVAEQAPDIALVDVEMPVLNGPEMAHGLFLRDCGDENIPIVLISGVVGLPQVASVVGTPYFLAKPFSPESLLRLIDRAVQEHIGPRPLLEAQ
jgi:two-component system cell cycle response regulator DivK